MITLGVVVGNRGFFPAHLCDTGRKEILATLEKLGFGVVILPIDGHQIRRGGILGGRPQMRRAVPAKRGQN